MKEYYRELFIPIEDINMEKVKFKDIYRCYVIRDSRDNYFVGPESDMYRVALRNMAVRFTKEEALDYIKNGLFCDGDSKYYIEDAV